MAPTSSHAALCGTPGPHFIETNEIAF